MARRNSVVFSGSLAMNSAATSGNIDIPVPAMSPDEGEQYLLNVKNAGAIDVSMTINNMVTFISTSEVVPIDDAITISASTNKGIVVTGFPLADGGRLAFTKAAGTAATINVQLIRA